MKVCVLFLIRILIQSVWEVVLKVTNLVATIANERRKEKRDTKQDSGSKNLPRGSTCPDVVEFRLVAGAAAADAAPPRLRSERSRPKG